MQDKAIGSSSNALHFPTSEVWQWWKLRSHGKRGQLSQDALAELIKLQPHGTRVAACRDPRYEGLRGSSAATI